jgi:hypothetical protein
LVSNSKRINNVWTDRVRKQVAEENICTSDGKATQAWEKKLHNEKIHNLKAYASAGINGMMGSKRMRWTRHVAHMGNINNA